MPPPKPLRRLPLLVERSVHEVETLRTDLSEKFELATRNKVSLEKKVITCTPGCASCCHHPVLISVLEGISIYRWLSKKGKWNDKLKFKLKETSDRQYGVAFEVWLMAMIPCPLLDKNNRCTAYEARPLICRSYYATSDPHNCHPHHLDPNVTEIVDRSSVTDPFHAAQEKVLLSHKLQLLAVPIGTALLLAERVCTGDLDLESVDGEVLKEYVQKG